ncbi:MAG: sulfotransferase domain-containing protein [Magnetococcales bacterium]|nr:sulfotransferase domain-containing protein [Magnetococcales bacterium]
MNPLQERQEAPILFLSVFKSGTWLVRRILEVMTGLACHEPVILPGRSDPGDPGMLTPRPGSFYSWHLHPTPPVREKIRGMNGAPVLLMRNVYDLVVSMYHHFRDNIDGDIGRGRNVSHYFTDCDREEGMRRIIEGFTRPDFRWRGLSGHLMQMELMLTLADEHPSLVTTYERMAGDKAGEIRRLAAFLGIGLTPTREEEILRRSGFDHMRQEAVRQNGGSHFRVGRPQTHLDELSERNREQVRTMVARQVPRLPELARQFDLPEILAGADPD